MRYKFFTNSMSTWRAMYEAMGSAEHYIYLEMYIWLTDIAEFDFLALLIAKARQGVKVRIILDSLGSSGFGEADARSLRENGVDLLFANNLIHHTHRKILVVDGKVAFVGGVNLHKVATDWLDMAIRIRDSRLVVAVERSFIKSYLECGGEDPALIFNKRTVRLPRTRTWIVEHFPSTRNFGMKNAYKKYIGLAQKNITLVTPYFVPKPWLGRLLKNARQRGVQIEVLVPERTDNPLGDRIEKYFMRELSLEGVQFFLEPEMNHAKLMLIDGRQGIVGSHNLDFLSFELNSEVGIFFEDSGSIRKLENIITGWKKNSRIFNPDEYQPSLLDHFLSLALRIFFRII